MLRTMSSPNIVQFYSMVIADNDDSKYLYIMEEWCECNLFDAINHRFDWLTYAKKLDILVNIASGLERVVDGGLFHGDVKSTNIVLKGQQPKLCDFGSASFMRKSAQDYEKTRIVCTPQWAAPEVTIHNWRVNEDYGECGWQKQNTPARVTI